MTYDLVLVDTGVDLDHPGIQNWKCDGLTLSDDGITNDFSDSIGHGTAVFYVAKRCFPSANILSIKIYNSDESALMDLASVLDYIYQKIECRVINLSLGITACEDLPYLHTVCRALTEKGIIIVAAFDNRGVVSYPAAFDNVIGVDTSVKWTRLSSYEVVLDQGINIIGMGLEQRIPWKGGTFCNLAGASFVAPHFAALLCKWLNKGATREQAIARLKQGAVSINKEKKNFLPKGCDFEIKTAITFPFNKEIHSVIRFKDYLDIDLVKVCDSKFNGNVGKNVASLLHTSGDAFVENIDSFDWEEEFDTLILGHVHQLSALTKKDYIALLLNKCITYKKNVCAFDDLSDYPMLLEELRAQGASIYYPPVLPYRNSSYVTSSKLHMIGKPVLGVWGTSSQQGKFTVQIELKQLLEESGYNVGFLGSEPSSALFGAQATYPFGYGNKITIHGDCAVKYINDLMAHIESMSPDIIVVGSQSHTIPTDFGNTDMYPLTQHEFLLGTLPDAIILCVNVFDSISYIKDTIDYLKIMSRANIIALVISPLDRKMQQTFLSNQVYYAADADLESAQRILAEHFELPVFKLSSKENMKNLYNICIDFFSGDGNEDV